MSALWPRAELSCGTMLLIAGPVAIGDVYICPVCDQMASVVKVELPATWQGSYDPAQFKGRAPVTPG